MQNLYKKSCVPKWLLIGILPTILSASNLDSKFKTVKEIYNDAKYLNRDKPKVELEASVNAAFATWDSGLQDNTTGSDPKVEYNTESINYIETKVNAKVLNRQLFSYYKLSSSGTEEQTDSLRKNTSANAGISGYGLSFSPEFLIDTLDIDNRVLQTALTYTVKYRDEMYYGTATAKEDLVYWYSTNSTGTEGLDYNALDKNDKLSFKTEFKHLEHTVSLKYLKKMQRQRAKGIDYRIGYFETKYTKPAYMGYKVSGSNKSIIEQVEYNTKGLVLNVSNFQGAKKDRHNFLASLYYGFSNDMTANGNSTSNNLSKNQSLDYSAIFIDYSYKYNMLNNKYNKLYILGGGSMDYKKWSISNTQNDATYDLEAEKLYKLYAELSYKFSL